MGLMTVQECIHELSRKYGNTHIFAEVADGQESLAYVHAIRVVGDGDNAMGEVELSTQKFGRLRYMIPSEKRLIMRHPNYGTFQHGDRAYLIQRRPARQWRRGLCSDNSTIFDIAVARSGLTAGSVPHQAPTIQSAYTAQKYTLQEALELLSRPRNPYVSVALEGCWSILQHPETDAPNMFLVMYKLIEVCTITDTRNITNVRNNYLVTQVQEWAR